MTRALIASTIVGLFLVACAAEDADSLGRGPGGNGENGENGENGGDPGQTPGGDDTVPGATPPIDACKGLPHVGFANIDFVADRKPGEVGVNRRRVKPFSALPSEFQRTLGVVPTALAANAAAYGQDPARWYSEPTAGAVSLYTTYNLSFTSCYDTMTDAKYTTAPTATTAATECAAMQRKFWQRTPTPDETKACADLAVTGLADEAVARRRWAHACASILTSVGFTTY